MSTHLINTHEAKSRLSELIREAHEGREVIILRNGQPVAKLVPWPTERRVRVAGLWAGRVQYHGDVVGPDPELAALFDELATST